MFGQNKHDCRKICNNLYIFIYVLSNGSNMQYAIVMWNVYLFITKRYIMTLDPILVFCVVKVDPQS